MENCSDGVYFRISFDTKIRELQMKEDSAALLLELIAEANNLKVVANTKYHEMLAARAAATEADIRLKDFFRNNHIEVTPREQPCN